MFDDAQAMWRHEFEAAGIDYTPATITIFRDQVDTACGTQSGGVGPFYCPSDHGVYLDTRFFDALGRAAGVHLGDFAQAYVVAHEVGHHVQTLLGTLQRVRQADEQDPSGTNGRSVRLELQADCFAGIWTHSSYRRGELTPTDFEDALRAAAVVATTSSNRRRPARSRPRTGPRLFEPAPALAHDRVRAGPARGLRHLRVVSDYELTRIRLNDGRETTVYLVRHPIATTAVRVVCFPEPQRLDHWCTANDQAEAIVAGFFVRDPYRPLGEVRIGGEVVEHEPTAPPWGPERGCVHIDGGVEIARRKELAGEPAGDLLQAGPLLVSGGRSLIDGEDREGFTAGAAQFDSDITVERHPRCALGVERNRAAGGLLRRAPGRESTGDSASPSWRGCSSPSAPSRRSTSTVAAPRRSSTASTSSTALTRIRISRRPSPGPS